MEEGRWKMEEKAHMRDFYNVFATYNPQPATGNLQRLYPVSSICFL